MLASIDVQKLNVKISDQITVKITFKIIAFPSWDPNKQVLPDPSLELNQLRSFHTDVEFLSKEGPQKLTYLLILETHYHKVSIFQ